jgi:hypothetical protein
LKTAPSCLRDSRRRGRSGSIERVFAIDAGIPAKTREDRPAGAVFGW